MNEHISQQELNAAITQAEIRFRKMWKEDFQAALRGQLQDLIAHVESRVEAQIRVGG